MATTWTASLKAHEFFYENAGYSYGKDETPEQGRMRCAVALAEAEAQALENGWYCEWVNGDECIGCDCGNDDCACSTGAPHDCYWCTLRDSDGTLLESLGSICQPDSKYRRVVEAELASEALANRA